MALEIKPSPTEAKVKLMRSQLQTLEMIWTSTEL